MTSNSPTKNFDFNATIKTSKLKQILANSYPLELAQADKTQITNYFKASWKLYEWLFSGIDKTTKSIQPHPFRNTLAFY